MSCSWEKNMWCFLAQAELLPCDTGPVWIVGVWRSRQAVTLGTPCVRWPGSVHDFPWLCTQWLCRFCIVWPPHQSPLFSAAIHPSAGLGGITASLFGAVLAEVLFYLQDGRNPSSEWQRRASPATCRNNRYPSIVQVGNFAVVCPLSVLTSILILNESRKIFLSWRVW